MRTGVALLIATVFGFAACSSGEGWTADSEKEFRKQCSDLLNISSDSTGCDCFLSATKENFSSFEDFGKSKSASPAYTADLADCGLTLNP